MYAYVLDPTTKLEVKEEGDSYGNRVQLDEILKRLFYIHNKRPIIDLLNSLYDDKLGYDADITYLNKEAINESIHKRSVFISQECDMFIKVDYKGKRYEYLLEFQTRNDRSIGIRLFRYSFELKVQNVKNLDSNSSIVIELPNPYVIVLEENRNVPDVYEIILRASDGNSLKYRSKVLKYWEHDLNSLYKNNLYLLFPLKVFEVRKKISKIKATDRDSPIYDALIYELKDDIFKVSKEILEHIEMTYIEKKIDDAEYNEFGVVITNLTRYLCQEIDKLRDVEEDVDAMIKTFYDPKVEERGRLIARREDILELLEDVGSISDNVKKLVEKEEDLKVLQKWLKIAARVNSIDEFLNKITLH